MKLKVLLILQLVLCATFCLVTNKAEAQVDPHFSQFYAYPLWLNPGLTGVIDGDFRVNANYKSQWSSLSNPFSTKALSFDAYPFHNLGLGGTILNQSASELGYNYLNVLLSASYRAMLDYDQYNVVSIGLQTGIVNRRFDPNKLQFDSQWNPITGYDPGVPSGENIQNYSSLDMDVNVGIVYFNRDPLLKVNPFAGISLYHLMRPHEKFYSGSNERLPMRLNLHGGLKVKLTRDFYLTPQFIYIRQGNAQETDVELYSQYFISDNLELLLGGIYRFGDAIIPFVGFDLGDFTAGLSYDINVSEFKTASLNRGGMELSLSYIIHKKVRIKNMTCPKM